MDDVILTCTCVVRFRDTVIIRESDGMADGVTGLAAGDGCWHTIQQYEANRRATSSTTGTKQPPPGRESISILDVFDRGQLDCFHNLDLDDELEEPSLNQTSNFLDDDDSDYSESQEGIADKISTAWNSIHTVQEKLWENDFSEEEDDDEEELREQHPESPTKVLATAFLQQYYVYSR